MSKKINHLLVLALIIFVGIFLRFYNLSSIPTSLTIDEVNNGYNAYSLLKTGRDEWGFKLPPYFKSTGDYDSPVLIYLTVPPVWLFGLSEFSTRFPVAFFSVLTIPIVYLLCRKYLLKDKPYYLTLLATFLFATSQWHIYYSRSDFEAVIALFFASLNIYFLFRGIEKKSPLSFYIAFSFLYLAALTYHSNKISVPLINLLFIALNWKSFMEILHRESNNKKWRLIMYSVVYLILVIIFVKLYLLGPGAARSKMVFFTEDFDYKRALMTKLSEYGMSALSLPMLALFWFKRFLEYFSPNFYLIDGLGLTIPSHPGAGVLNLALFPLYLIGLLSSFLAISKKKSSNLSKFLIGWLIIGFLPATLANNSQHALRSLNASIPVIILSTIGFSAVCGFLVKKSKLITWSFLSLIIFLFCSDFVRFTDYYTVHYPQELSEFRQYGWKEMALFAKEVHKNYDNVYIDPRFGTEGRTSYGVPYLYFLFYSLYDPHTYHTFPGRERFISDFENYHFLEIDLNQVGEIKGNNLYIASPWSFPDDMIQEKFIVNRVKFLNGKVGFYAISNKPKNEKQLK